MKAAEPAVGDFLQWGSGPRLLRVHSSVADGNRPESRRRQRLRRCRNLKSAPQSFR